MRERRFEVCCFSVLLGSERIWFQDEDEGGDGWRAPAEAGLRTEENDSDQPVPAVHVHQPGKNPQNLIRQQQLHRHLLTSVPFVPFYVLRKICLLHRRNECLSLALDTGCVPVSFQPVDSSLQQGEQCKKTAQRLCEQYPDTDTPTLIEAAQHCKDKQIAKAIDLLQVSWANL